MTTAPSALRGWPGLPDTERKVLRELLLHGPQSRVRIAEKVGLSRASLTRVARGLLDSGFVTEGATENSGLRGRPAEILRLRPEAAHFAGVKLTGDVCYVVVIDLAARVVAEAESELPSRQVADVVATVARLLRDASRDGAEPAGVGVAVAGDVVWRDGSSILMSSPFLGWAEVPLARLLGEATGLPVTVSNDVQALTAAQHWFGGLAPHRSMVVYGLGAGIGSGIVVHDEILGGAHGRAGRVGHTRIGGAGALCNQGHRDCVHSFVTIPAIEANAGDSAGSYAEVVARARAGGAGELRAFREAGRAMGAIIAEAVNTLDPEIVLVLGEGRELFEFAPDEVHSGLSEHLELGDPASVRIETPPFTFGEYARGAAVAALRDRLT